MEKERKDEMDRREIETLRDRVDCAALLAKEGFGIDQRQSTRRAQKFRRGDEIVIVIHEGRGWFDARSEAKGDIFSLAHYLTGSDFHTSLALIGDLAGVAIDAGQPCASSSDKRTDGIELAERWTRRYRPWRGSQTAEYLVHPRALPWSVILAALARDLLREGPHGSVWAKHADDTGGPIGWEERGLQWRGFASGGSKELFRFGPTSALRVCITKAAIDAMSLAALEGLRRDTLYTSTGGGWAPRTKAAIEHYAGLRGVHLVAATDANVQGEIYADGSGRLPLMRNAISRGCARRRKIGMRN